MGAEGSTPGRVEATAVLESTGLAPVPIEVIRAWWAEFRQLYPRPAVNSAGFVSFFGRVATELSARAEQHPGSPPGKVHRREEALQRVFVSLDKSGRCVVDGLEFFAALGLLARGRLEARAVFLFELFDFAGRGLIDRAALGLLIERVGSGLQKTCSCLGLRVPKELPCAMAQRCFKGLPLEHEITLAEFSTWWHNEGLVRQVLQKFVASVEEEDGLPELDQCHWEPYKELDEPDNSLIGSSMIDWGASQWMRCGALSTVPESSAGERDSGGDRDSLEGTPSRRRGWPPEVDRWTAGETSAADVASYPGSFGANLESEEQAMQRAALSA